MRGTRFPRARRSAVLNLFSPVSMMRRFLAAAALTFVAATAPAAAQPLGTPMLLTSDSSRALLDAGRAALLDLRFGDAEASFRRLQARPDGAPAALLARTHLALYRAFLQDDEAQLAVFTRRADSLDRVLAPLPDTRWRTYLGAEADLLRALVHVRKEQMARAAFAGRDAYNGYERAVRGTPVLHEAELGFGLVQLLIGSAPRTYQTLLRLLGFRGTVEGGRARILRAAEADNARATEAQLVLSVLDPVIRNDREAGRARAAALHTAHPASPLVGFLYGYTLVTDRRVSEAMPVLDAVVAQGAQPGATPVRFASFYLADAHLKAGRPAEAERHARTYLRTLRGVALRAQAQRLLGTALELQGRHADAVAVFRQIRKTRISENEEAAVRYAQRFIAAPMTPDEQALLRAEFAYEDRRHAEAEAAFRALLARTDATTAVRAEAQYRLARTLLAEGAPRRDEAKRAFEAVLAAPGPDALAGFAPWAHFYLGEIAQQENRRADARRAFEAALRVEGAFDYHQSLEQRAKAALETVR